MKAEDFTALLDRPIEKSTLVSVITDFDKQVFTSKCKELDQLENLNRCLQNEVKELQVVRELYNKDLQTLKQSLQQLQQEKQEQDLLIEQLSNEKFTLLDYIEELKFNYDEKLVEFKQSTVAYEEQSRRFEH